MNTTQKIALCAFAVLFGDNAFATDRVMSEQADVPPRLVSKTMPVWPVATDGVGREQIWRDATVEVAYGVDCMGHVEDVKVQESIHSTGRLNAAAIRAVAAWVYEPAQRNGETVAATGLRARVIFHPVD